MSTSTTPRTDELEALMQGQTFTCNAAHAYTLARQLETELAAAKADTERIDRLASYWNSQHTGQQALLGGRMIANPTGSFRDALDADCAKPAPASPEGLREAVEKTVNAVYSKPTACWGEMTNAILTAIAPFVGDGNDCEMIDWLEKRAAELGQTDWRITFQAGQQHRIAIRTGHNHGFPSLRTCLNAARRLEDAARSANQAADRMETVLHQLRMMTEDGYRNNVTRLIELLSKEPTP